ncbi:hypothetical protein FBDF15_26440 [Faecalibacterium duncaniae]
MFAAVNIDRMPAGAGTYPAESGKRSGVQICGFTFQRGDGKMIDGQERTED